MSRIPSTRPRWIFKFCLIGSLAAATASWPTQSARAADVTSLAESLKFIPAKASTYTAMLRNKEVFNNVADSKAWKTFKEMPVVKQTWESIQDEIDEPLGAVEQFFDDPLNQDLLKTLVDMVSDEIFVYGDENLPEWVAAYQVANFSRMMSPLEALGAGVDPGVAQLRGMFRAIDARKDKLVMPHSVIGFRIKDAEKAKVQLTRLELLLAFLPAAVPDLKDAIKHETVAGVDYLTITISGSIIPWDEVPWDEIAEKEGEFKPLVEKLKQMKFVIGLGVREKFVVLSLGAPVTELQKFGQGQLLANLPEMQKLTPFADKRATSISYSSAALREAGAAVGTQWETIRKAFFKGLSEGLHLPDELNEKINKDVQGLEGQFQRPKYSATVGVGFFVEHGFEHYEFDWMEHPGRDGSQKLPLLQHLGGHPLAFGIHRTKRSLEGYEVLVKLVKLGKKYLEELAVPNFSPEEKDIYQKVMLSVSPLVTRIDQVTREKLFPALADGQSAIVVDAQISSKQWLADVPQAARLPMLEFGLVYGVSKRDLLEKAGADLRDAANDFLSQLDQFDTPFQLVRIPTPKSKDLDQGKQYLFPLPEEWGLDRQITPNIGLSDTVLALSSSTKQTERMLKPTPLKFTGVLADTDRPLAAAHYCHVAGFVDFLTPWLELATREIMTRGAWIFNGFLLVDENARPRIMPAQNDPAEVKEALEQLQTFLDIVKCFHSVAGVTYRDAGVWVERSESVFHDLP